MSIESCFPIKFHLFDLIRLFDSSHYILLIGVGTGYIQLIFDL